MGCLSSRLSHRDRVPPVDRVLMMAGLETTGMAAPGAPLLHDRIRYVVIDEIEKGFGFIALSDERHNPIGPSSHEGGTK